MHTKLLIRPLNFELRFQQWIDNGLIDQLNMLRGSYANEVFGEGSDDLSHLRSDGHSRIIWQPAEIESIHLGFMCEYFKSKLESENYYIFLSDEREEIYDSGLKLSIHRHFLKPEKDEHSPDFNVYGNVIIEHHFSPGHKSLLISVNYFNTKRYLSFERLMELLLS